jgi:hypothetical protein
VVQITYAVERQFVDRGSELDVRVLIRPAEVGSNGIRVIFTAPATGISDLRLLFIRQKELRRGSLSRPSLSVGPVWLCSTRPTVCPLMLLGNGLCN